VRSVFGKKIGLANTNAIDDGSLERTVRRSEDIARVQPDLEDFVSLPAPAAGDEAEEIPPGVLASRTAEFTPEARAEAVGLVTRAAAAEGFQAAGAFETGVMRLGVANSLGMRRYVEFTRARLTAIVMGPSGSGYGATWASERSPCRRGGAS